MSLASSILSISIPLNFNSMAKLVTSHPLGNSGSWEMTGTSTIFETCKGDAVTVTLFFVNALIKSSFSRKNHKRIHEQTKEKESEDPSF